MPDYPIVTAFPSNNKEVRKEKITAGVIHATVGSFSSAVGWLRNPASKVSSHYVISKQGLIFQLVDPVTHVAWHAGDTMIDGKMIEDFNAVTVSYELENKNDGKDVYPAKQLDALTWLVQRDMARFKIPVTRIYRHLDVCFPKNRKTDPANFPWNSWRERLGLIVTPTLRIAVNTLLVRAGPGISFAVVGRKINGEIVTPLEIREGDTVDGNNKWVRIGQDQWISMRYVT